MRPPLALQFFNTPIGTLHTVPAQGRRGAYAGAAAALRPAKRPNTVLSPMESPLA